MTAETNLTVRQQAELAQQACRALRIAGADLKNAALRGIADGILRNSSAITAANEQDVKAATAAKCNSAFIDRLQLGPERLQALAKGVQAVAELPDPVGEILSHERRPNGLEVSRVRVPIGVIALIYEARPGVTVESGILCLKSGNACLLRSGSEAARTSQALARIMREAIAAAGLPADCVQVLSDLSHGAVTELVQLEGLVDLVIPRGGEGLIRRVVENARVPVLKHYKGVCHAYIHPSADPEKAARVVLNSKCQRPGVCNALETLLVDSKVAPAILPVIARELLAAGVELRGDEAVRALIPDAAAATEEDWFAEYLDLVLSVRVVDGVDAAIAHINHYGSKHTDTILAEDPEAQSRFLRDVDSAAVLVNASTRLCDGGELGLGAEIGISTDKLHARGPMGLLELTTYQWQVVGSGHIRS